MQLLPVRAVLGATKNCLTKVGYYASLRRNRAVFAGVCVNGLRYKVSFSD